MPEPEVVMTADMEFTGRNVKKAVQRAAQALEIPEDELKFDILSHGSTGIFGLAGIKKARIRVVSVPTKLKPDAEFFEKVDQDFPSESEVPDTTETDSETEGAQEVGEALLRRIVDAISPESSIAIDKNERRIRFHIKGGQSGILIGKRGQTLEAMQLLVEKALRRLNGPAIRIQVDVEGYLAKKKASLVRTAERLAKKVADKGSPASIGYLNAQDRRVVHLALKNQKKVRTQSVGEGPFRKLMIYPRRKPKQKLG